MEGLKKLKKNSKKEQEIARALRAWQRRAKARRCSLAALASSVGVTRRKIESMMARGPRCRLRKAGETERICQSALPVARWRKHKLRPGITTAAPVIAQAADAVRSVRSVRRILAASRAERMLKYKRYWRKWHLRNPNRGISQEGMDEMFRCSPWMWG